VYVNWTLISVLMNVRVLKIYVLGLIDELNWMLWGWLLWVIDYLVDYRRLWWFWVMNCVNYEFWVRNMERTVGFLLKFWVGGWRWQNFGLVPQFVKITV
jgi:hypothetical protein